MISKLLLSTALVVVGASSGFAQGFSGGELGLEYSLFDDLDTSTTSYFGSVEYEITPQIAIAADFSFFNAEDSDESPTNGTIHGIYKTAAGGSFGVFVGQDSLEDVSGTIYGAEGAYDFGLGQIQAYFGVADTDDDVNFLGAEVDYDFGSGFGFIGAVDVLNIESNSSTLTEIGGTYTIANGPVIFAKIGNVGLDIDEDGITGEDDFNYVAVGASIGFGPDNGVTFSTRGAFSTSPLAF